MMIAIVGPDGAGKTKLSRALEDTARSAGSHFGCLHWRPSMLVRPLPSVPSYHPYPPPKHTRPSNVSWRTSAVSVPRLLRSWCTFLLTYAVRLRGYRRRSPGTRECVVVLDCWILNYLGRPDSVRYFGPPALARVAIKTSPPPLLTVLVAVKAVKAVTRKGELSLSEAAEELSRWRHLRPPGGLLVVDGGHAANDLANAALDFAHDIKDARAPALRRIFKTGQLL